MEGSDWFKKCFEYSGTFLMIEPFSCNREGDAMRDEDVTSPDMDRALGHIVGAASAAAVERSAGFYPNKHEPIADTCADFISHLADGWPPDEKIIEELHARPDMVEIAKRFADEESAKILRIE